MRRSLLILLATMPLALAACGSDDSADNAGTPPPAASTPAAEATTPEAASTPESTDSKDAKCEDVAEPKVKDGEVAKPTGSLSPDKTYKVTLETSCGSIVITLDQKNDPKTANVFASLTKAGYYNGLGFHRVVPDFVIQGGDPAGDGSGGPSWKVVEAPPASQKYTRGVVAMAKTGSDPDGTSGSQFFIVTGADVGLPPQYAVAGNVTSGMNVADAISALGTAGSDGPPSKPAVIEKATLSES